MGNGLPQRLRAWLDRGALPDEHELLWLMDGYAWLVEHAPAGALFLNTRCIQPTTRDFPVDSRDAEDFASKLFELVKDHAAMGQWPCELVLLAEEERLDQLMGAAMGATQHTDINGWFSMAPGRPARIGIRLKLADDWEHMVGVLAHELGHYRLAQVERSPPGGPERVEAVTDLCAVAMGFGLFMANRAVRARGWNEGASMGWAITGNAEGYLSERELAAALAMFTALTEADTREVARSLAPTPRRTFRVAQTWLAEHHPEWASALRRRHGGPIRW